ncbi:MAG: hypothetical protein ACOX3G_09415 [Armatimonadota bacterium]|jgi:hypothetical protein
MIFRNMLIAAAILTGLLCGACPAADYKINMLKFNDYPEIDSITLKSIFYGHNSAVDRPITGGEPAYNYSVHIIKDGERYRMYAGGRWRRPGIKCADGDHVMQYISATGKPNTWKMPYNRPEFFIGCESGKPGQWFSNNCLEPEVLKVNGVYYMYTQVQIDPGTPLDIPGVKAKVGADRILLFTSRNGYDWTRFEERGVVVNVDSPETTALHHQEMVYVPWDKDKKPFWMYVAVNTKKGFEGYSRIRSADPKTFDWNDREKGVNLAQLGNQIAYAAEAPGGPLFVRITFTGNDTGRTVPTLQFSRDGLKWQIGDNGPALLDGSHDDAFNKNCYFLGISTIDGTGALERIGDNTYRAIYAATTSNSPGGAEIWKSQVGVGELVFTINPKGK